MGLRERLAGIARRRAFVRIQVDDTSGKEMVVAAARVRLGNAQQELDRVRADEPDADVVAAQEHVEAMRGELVAAVEAMRGCFVAVELQALLPSDWEALVATYPAPNEGAWVDWSAALPVAMAASCVEVDLQDEAWWAEWLVKPELAAGQVDTLRSQVLELNLRPFDVAPAPFG